LLATLAGVGFLMAATAQETFDAVIKKYSGIKSLKAEFIEQVCNKSTGSCQMLRGSFVYASPNKYRLDVTIPTEQLIVSDGQTSWVYVPSANQAIKMTPGPEQEIFLFIGHLNNYSDIYNVRLEETEQWLQAHFSAKPGHQVFLEQFTLLLDQSTNTIVGLKFEQPDTEILFSLEDQKRNLDLAAGEFSFTPPEGTTIIRETGSVSQ